jgi:hypothetical protein
MNLKNYIHNLQQRPVRERERIAVIATAIGFAVIFLIWIVSFKEMNKPAETQPDPTSASLNDLKNNFQTGKDSIQDMMQQLPSDTLSPAPTDNSGAQPNNNSLNLNDSTTNPESIPSPTKNNSSDQNNQDKPAVPQLP